MDVDSPQRAGGLGEGVGMFLLVHYQGGGSDLSLLTL